MAFAGDDLERRLRAEAQIERDLAAAPSAETRAAAGVRELLAGRTKRAVSALEAALLAQPDDPRIQSDLAVALYLQGVQDGGALDLVRSLAHAKEAIRLAPRNPEARFNLALILESLHATGGARRAWEGYLASEPADGRWTLEARRHLEVLMEPSARERWAELRPELALYAFDGDLEGVRQLVRAFPEQALDEAERWLFIDWSRAAQQEDDTQASEVLAAIDHVARALPPEAGGDLLREAVAHARSLRVGRSTVDLARAYGELALGISEIERYEVGRAEAPFERAIEGLAAYGSPYLQRARMHLASCRYLEMSYSEASTVLGEVLQEGRRISDLKTELFSLQLLGTIETVQNHLGTAIDRYRAALQRAEEAGWKSQVAVIESLLGETYGHLGDGEACWRHHLRGLALLGWVVKPRLHARIWSAVAEVAQSDEEATALYFADELVDAARESGLPLVQAVALLQWASVSSALGVGRPALKTLDEAEALVEQLSDANIAGAMSGDLMLARGEILMPDSPQEALDALEEAGEVFRQTGYELQLSRLLRLRARGWRALGQSVHAEESLVEAVEALEKALPSISLPRDRAAYMEEARRTYDELVDLQWDRGDTTSAFASVERSRWALGGGSLILGESPGATTRLPPETAVVMFRALPNRLLVWGVARDRVESVELPLTAAELAARVAASRRALLLRSDTDRVLEGLYELLLSPVAPLLEPATDIVVVPDGPLFGVPFSALRDSRTGRYLVQDASVTWSPSFIEAVDAIGGRASRDSFGLATSVLAVGNPSLGPLAGLPPLPQAEEEARRIAERFPRTTLLLGDSATEERVVEESRRHEVVHIAAHSFANERSPLLASLILAPGEASDGTLFAHEVLATSIESPRLAVLTGCSSGAGQGSTRNLAAAFVEAGVPEVVASLWAVEDRVGARLFDRFYENLVAGAQPADALRSAQLELLHSPDPELSHPASWAAFHVWRGGRHREESR